MKPESITISGKRETTSHEEKKRAKKTSNFPSVSSWSSNVFVRWFHLPKFLPSVRPLHWAQLKMGIVILHFRGWCSTCIFTSTGSAANSLSNPSRPLTSAWCRRKDHIRKLWFHTCSVIFNYRNHSSVTGWSTTILRSAGVSRRLYVCFFVFLFFSSISPSSEISLSFSL